MRKSAYSKKEKRSFFRDNRVIICAAVLVLAVVFLFSGRNCPLFISTRASKSAEQLSLDIREQTVISVLADGSVIKLGLEDYLVGVVGAEMPVGYDIEALKAQAVAARTYTIRKASRGGCNREEGADICTDSGHCQAYADEQRLRERWGGDYENNISKIKNAVYSTAGELLIYEGEAIEALFCASAGGRTEASENVYSQARDYLKSVESPDTEGYVFEKSFTRDEFVSLIKKKLSLSLSTKKLENQLEILSRYESGRVKQMRLGSKEFKGGKLRSALGLSSTNFIYEFSGDSIVFTSFGYGHGIGMSQSGAEALAKQGMTYDEILLYYYQGVSLTKE